MSSRSVRFASVVLTAFEAAGAATDVEVASAGGPSSTTMTKIRKAALGEHELAEPRGDTYRRIETVAGWQAGSARTLFRDGVRPLPELRRQRGLAAALGDEQPVVRKPVTPSGLDGFLGDLADRLLEVEERLDLLEQDLALERRRTAGLSEAAPTVSDVEHLIGLPSAAQPKPKHDEPDEESEQP